MYTFITTHIKKGFLWKRDESYIIPRDIYHFQVPGIIFERQQEIKTIRATYITTS